MSPNNTLADKLADKILKTCMHTGQIEKLLHKSNKRNRMLASFNDSDQLLLLMADGSAIIVGQPHENGNLPLHTLTPRQILQVLSVVELDKLFTTHVMRGV